MYKINNNNKIVLEEKMSDILYCGAAKAKITPSEDLIPWMFGLMDRKYGKVHDDLYVRVIALRSGEERMLLVVYDLDKATNPVEWTALLEKETGVPAVNILYTAIHTHTAPLTGYRPFEGPNFIGRKTPEVQEKVKIYENFLLEQLISCARNACEAMVPARFGYAMGSCDIGVNRCQEYRVLREDGSWHKQIGLGFNAEGIVDRTLLAVRFENAQTGAPIAFFTNYAVHCVASFLNDCGDGKSFISGDIAGAVSRALEEQYPGSVALWTSAPAGDINPVQMIQNCCPDMITGAPIERCAMGEDVADANIATLAGRQLAAIRETLSRVQCNMEYAPLSAAEDFAQTKCVKLDSEAIRPLLAAQKNSKSADNKEKMDAAAAAAAVNCTDDYRIRTHLLKIGPLALIGIDGELYTSHGQAIRAVSPAKDTFVINHDSSLRLDNPGYIADDATLQRVLACALEDPQTAAGRGGVPGGKSFTAPGTVKKALEESTGRLFETIG